MTHDLHLLARKQPRLIAPLNRLLASLIDQAAGRAQGPDLAHYELYFDPDLATEQIDFSIFKLTEGAGWVDPLVDEIWTGVKKTPLRLGYHYGKSADPWTSQVTNYLGTASKYDLHGHIFDLEGYENELTDTFFADTRRWLDDVEAKTGQKIILYTNNSIYKLFEAAILRLYADGREWLDKLLLWIAWPSSIATQPLLPAGRATAVIPWLFWQLAWDGDPKKWGTGAFCDVNIADRTPAALLEFFGVTTPPPPDPNPEPAPDSIHTLRVEVSALNGRSTPEVADNIIFQGGFKKDDILLAEDPILDTNGKTKWYPVLQCIRSGALVPLPASPTYASDGGASVYLKLLASLPCSVPALKPESVTFTVERDGYAPLTLTGTQEPL